MGWLHESLCLPSNYVVASDPSSRGLTEFGDYVDIFIWYIFVVKRPFTSSESENVL